MRTFLLTGALALFFSSDAFSRATNVVERWYDCPSVSKMKYTVDYTNTAKGGDGYKYKASNKKDKNITPKWKGVSVSGKINKKLTIRCKMQVRGGKKITYKMTTSVYKLGTSSKRCKLYQKSGKVMCKMYK